MFGEVVEDDGEGPLGLLMGEEGWELIGSRVGASREAGTGRDKKDKGIDGKYRRFRRKEHQPTKGRRPPGGSKWEARSWVMRKGYIGLWSGWGGESKDLEWGFGQQTSTSLWAARCWILHARPWEWMVRLPSFSSHECWCYLACSVTICSCFGATLAGRGGRRGGWPGTKEGLQQFILEREVGLSSYGGTSHLILVLWDSFLLILKKIRLASSTGWDVSVTRLPLVVGLNFGIFFWLVLWSLEQAKWMKS